MSKHWRKGKPFFKVCTCSTISVTCSTRSVHMFCWSCAHPQLELCICSTEVYHPDERLLEHCITWKKWQATIFPFKKRQIEEDLACTKSITSRHVSHKKCKGKTWKGIYLHVNNSKFIY